VEYLGLQETEPSDFPKWKDSYKGKAIAKLYKLDYSTGMEGKVIGWKVR
jgi:hypothetical protein